MHCAHDELAARPAMDDCSLDGGCAPGELSLLLSGGGEGGEDESPCWGPRGMMVLFVKQVHLQNVGAANEGRKGAVRR